MHRLTLANDWQKGYRPSSARHGGAITETTKPATTIASAIRSYVSKNGIFVLVLGGKEGGVYIIDRRQKLLFQ